MLKRCSVQCDNEWMWEEEVNTWSLHCDVWLCPPELCVRSLIPSAMVLGVFGSHAFHPHKCITVLLQKWIKDPKVSSWPWPLTCSLSALGKYSIKALASCQHFIMGLLGFQSCRDWISFLINYQVCEILLWHTNPAKATSTRTLYFQTNKPLES